MLIIRIKDLVAEGKHGVHPEEKTTAQPFSIDVEVTLRAVRASHSDKLEDTLDWSRLRQLVIETVQNNSFDLLERLAGAIADAVLLDARASQVIVTIDKPQAFKSGVPGVRLAVKSPAVP